MSDTPLEVSAAEAKRLLWEAHPGEMLLLDCRTPDEHATAKIAGALLLPMQELPERIGELEAWKAKPIIVHCHHGVRSAHAIAFLRGQGFSRLTNLSGGIDRWSTELDPSIARY